MPASLEEPRSSIELEKVPNKHITRLIDLLRDKNPFEIKVSVLSLSGHSQPGVAHNTR